MVQSWTNADGLYLEFGPDKATPAKAGEYVTVGALREVEVTLTLSELTETESVVDKNVQIPAGVRIKEVEVVTHTAAATGTAIDVGMIALDRSTEIDYNGFLAAKPTSQMNAAGERTVFTASSTVPASQTGTGALIGTTIATTGYITASRTDSTAFTAGVVKVYVRFYKP